MDSSSHPGRRAAVCIVHNYYYPEHGHVRRDAETLIEAGYDVTVIALRRDEQPGREVVNGVRVHRLPLQHRRGHPLQYVWHYGRLMLLTFLTLTWLHARRRFQVVEIDNMPDLLVFSALVPKLTGARVIFYIFDHMPELLMVTRGVGRGHPLVRVLTLLERLSASFADRVVVTQEMSRRLVTSRGVPDHKVSIVLNGPDERIFWNRSHPTVTPPAGSFQIVTHGTVLERFGIQVLIDALPQIAAEAPAVILDLYGDGEYRPALEARVRQLGLADRVNFHDWVPLESLPALLANADLGYVGMLCDNMLSNKLMEYVALGVPVVLSRWPIYEQYFSSDSVTYFQPGNADDLARAVLEVYHRPEEARDRRQRASALFKQYGWSVQQETYKRVYAELVDEQSHPTVASGAVTQTGLAGRTAQQRELQAALDRLIADRDDLTILEAGCGSASMVNLPAHAHIVGIDISQHQLDRNQSLSQKIRGDIQTYPLPPEAFDLVICWDVLEHLPRPELALENLHQSLKPGGLLALALPNAFSAKGLLTKLTPRWFHTWTYRAIYRKQQVAGNDYGPFPTFMRWSISPPALRSFADQRWLAIEHFQLTESVFQSQIRARIGLSGLPWSLLKQLCLACTFGKVTLDGTEVGVVLRKEAA